MQETSPGKFQKCGAVPIEVEASRKDTYKCLLARAMKKCKMVQKRESSFFKLNGTRILDEPLTVNGKEKDWTLGNYLQVVKKSPSSLMLGIAILPAYSKEQHGQTSDEDNSTKANESTRHQPSELVEASRGLKKGSTPMATVMYYHKDQLAKKAPVPKSR